MARKTRRNRRLIKCDEDAVKLLRIVGEEEAFNFYAAVGQPTGERAVSLPDFLEKTKTVELESLVFHLQRKDFQNWLKKTIGDSDLARKIGRIRVSCDDRVRMKISAAVESRLRGLREEPPVSVLVNEKPVVASPS